jgi:excinuclease ABC subunit A
VRVDADAKIKRLGGRVQVIQDRIAITKENRARLVEAIETALRFGKGQVNAIPISDHRPVRRSLGDESPITDHIPFSTGWHCAYCDLDICGLRPGFSVSTIHWEHVRSVVASVARFQST